MERAYAAGSEENVKRYVKTTKRIVRVIILMPMIFCIGGCSKKESAESGKLKVTATMFAAYDFAKQVGGDLVDVNMLLAPGSESHTYEPTPRDIIGIGNSDVFICAGGEGDVWVDSILDSIDNKNLIIIRMTDCVEVLEEELKEGMQEEEEEEEGEEGEPEWDEHVWMSPLNAKLISEKLTEAYISCDKENESEYKKLLAQYEEKLDDIDKKLRDTIDNAGLRTIVFADRFPARYFVEEYGLDYFAAFPGCSENAEASAATVSFLIDKVKSEQIPVVFKIELSNGRLADIVSEASGAKIMTFYTGHNVSADDMKAGVTYIDMLERDLEALKTALY